MCQYTFANWAWKGISDVWTKVVWQMEIKKEWQSLQLEEGLRAADIWNGRKKDLKKVELLQYPQPGDNKGTCINTS